MGRRGQLAGQGWRQGARRVGRLGRGVVVPLHAFVLVQSGGRYRWLRAHLLFVRPRSRGARWHLPAIIAECHTLHVARVPETRRRHAFAPACALSFVVANREPSTSSSSSSSSSYHRHMFQFVPRKVAQKVTRPAPSSPIPPVASTSSNPTPEHPPDTKGKGRSTLR